MIKYHYFELKYAIYYLGECFTVITEKLWIEKHHLIGPFLRNESAMACYWYGWYVLFVISDYWISVLLNFQHFTSYIFLWTKIRTLYKCEVFIHFCNKCSYINIIYNNIQQGWIMYILDCKWYEPFTRQIEKRKKERKWCWT